MLWFGPLVLGGDLFGTTPTVQDDFAWVIGAIVAAFLLPLTIEYAIRRPRRYPPAAATRQARELHKIADLFPFQDEP